MSNIVKALKKGNQTLTEKIRNLEDEKKVLLMEIERLNKENMELRQKVEYKKRNEDELINHFSGIYSKLLHVAASNMLEE